MKLITLKYHWYYLWGSLACSIVHTRVGDWLELPYTCYNHWMGKASDIDEKYDLGYWTYYNEDGTVKRAARK